MTKKLFGLTQKRKRLLEKIRQISFFMTGSFMQFERTCGNKNCKCMRGKKHVGYVLKWKEKEGWKAFYPAAKQQDDISMWVLEYKKLKELVDEMAKVQRQILQETK